MTTIRVSAASNKVSGFLSYMWKGMGKGMMMKTIQGTVWAALTSALLLVAPPLTAQNGTPSLEEAETDDSSRAAARTLQAVRVQGVEPEIDGNLNDDAWQNAAVATGFVQLEPEEGAAASQPTEARVLYGADALYVAFRAFDSAPDSIEAQLARRDQMAYSDWVHVVVDSYNDQRTAFHFGTNPRGVKVDLYRFDDTREDSSWDAVWDVATRVDDEGWTAEFRIPFSQLRYSDEPVKTWGINFAREIARHQETSTWAPLSQQEERLVSRSGKLVGLRDVEPASRVEVEPYAWARADRRTRDPESPFYEETAWGSELGADVKYRVTNNLTLDLTINPDFGQVEADPAQVNLSANETFYPEKRPFFIEGGGIFNFPIGVGDGDLGSEGLFYSRRIGRAPQRGADPRGGFVDAPEQSRIWGAWKLSGKTESGWSVGALHAVTGEETADVVTGAGEPLQDPVEPLTNYTVGRVQRDFREGQSALGAVATVTARDGDVADELALHRTAVTGGADVRHRFGEGGHFEVTGQLLGSHVRGTAEAIARTQRSPVRYFQRPDADHVEYDPTRMSLTGWAGSAGVAKVGGGNWRFISHVLARSPAFEVNDVGFQQEGDMLLHLAWVGYQQSEPGDVFRRWNLGWNAWHGYTFGGERVGLSGNVNGSFTLLNQWSGFAGVNYQAERLSTGWLRGGPALQIDPGWNGWIGINSDPRDRVRFHPNVNWSLSPESDSWSLNVSPRVSWRPSSAASVSLGTFYNRNVNDRQWVGRVMADTDAQYVLGRLDQTTAGLTGRVDYAFTPDLTLQLYAQPFVSAGEYGEFKGVTDPRAERYDDRMRLLDYQAVGEGEYAADVDGDGTAETFGNPDFNFKQFRSNAVLRWEYRPGSTLFLVWSQGRTQWQPFDGSFALGDDTDQLFSIRPENVFMVKVSYWLNP